MAQSQRGNSPAKNGTVGERVVSAVADARGVNPLALPPLYNVIDPDALDAFLESVGSGGREGPGRVEIRIEGPDVGYTVWQGPWNRTRCTSVGAGR
jgi:hypothetical protein